MKLPIERLRIYSVMLGLERNCFGSRSGDVRHYRTQIDYGNDEGSSEIVFRSVVGSNRIDPDKKIFSDIRITRFLSG